MKKVVFIFALISVFSSCAPTVYYQLHETKATSDNISKELKYEDDNCIISYDFWSDKGSSGFIVYNKSDKNLYIDMNNCFFIKNEQAYDYFLNRAFSYSKSIGASNIATKAVTGINYYGYIQQNKIGAGVSSSKGSSVSYLEKDIICIPPKTQKSFYEYSISNIPFRHCDIKKYPYRSKDVASANFDYSESPVKFGNIIVYKIKGENKEYFIKNDFYVDKITNYPSTLFKSSRKVVNCPKGDYNSASVIGDYIKVNNFQGKDKYYIRYTSSNSSWDESVFYRLLK